MAAVVAAGILNVRPPTAQTPFWSRHIEARRARITQIVDDILDTLGD
ncbi:MAG TPA: hypothetical protein VJS67_05205 [Pseudonocardiaceae bacterium]|nr:hypothetical protein [Pseudonocardiaceae bacterium]